MAELTIEEKAKAYDEAIRKAKDMLFYKETRQEDIEYLFPELKESSEEDRIRKNTISIIRDAMVGNVMPLPLSIYQESIAWLEKHNEKKTTDEKQGEQNNFQKDFQKEDIKGQLINYFKVESRFTPHRKERHDKWIAWLEKQDDNTQVKKEKADDKFECPFISMNYAPEVISRLPHIDEDLMPIVKFIIECSHWNLHKDEWNQPTLEVPLFRVLDAFAQKGKAYCGG